MSATVTSISAGPRTQRATGLPANIPVLPSEPPAQFEAFRAAVLDRFSPQAPEDVAAVLDYIDATWRLRRIALHEAELITLEIRRMQDDPALAQILPTLTPTAAEALAVERLFASKALVNLHRLEERLNRRLARVKPILDFLAERANEREFLRRQSSAQTNPQNNFSTTVRKIIDISRNQLCPCGSGLKFKRCCISTPPTPETAAQQEAA